MLKWTGRMLRDVVRFGWVNQSPAMSATILLLLLAAFVALPASADPAIWELKGRKGSVLLLGSIHMMRESDYPLPDNVMAAYEESDRIIMELDMDDLDPMMAQSLITSIGMLDDGRSLRDVMGARDYERASRKLSAMGLELDLDSRGFGLRSQRYAMIVDDGVVTALQVEEGGAFEVSSAEAVLAAL